MTRAESDRIRHLHGLVLEAMRTGDDIQLAYASRCFNEALASATVQPHDAAATSPEFLS